jgi:hypothetical protein
VLLLLRQRGEVELPVHFRRGGVGWVRARWCEAFAFGFALKLSRGS